MKCTSLDENIWVSSTGRVGVSLHSGMHQSQMIWICMYIGNEADVAGVAGVVR